MPNRSLQEKCLRNSESKCSAKETSGRKLKADVSALQAPFLSLVCQTEAVKNCWRSIDSHLLKKLPMAVKNCINSDLSKNYPRRWELGMCVALGEGSDRKAVSGNYDWTLAGNESIRSRKSNSFFVAHPSSFFCCNCSEKIIDVISFQHCYSKQGWYHFQSAPITDQERCQGAKLGKKPWKNS